MNQMKSGDNQTASPNQRENDPKPPPIDPSREQNIITNSSQDKCHYKQDKWPSRVIASATIVIAFITFFYMLAAFQQVAKTKEAVRITANQFKALERPWIQIVNLKIPEQGGLIVTPDKTIYLNMSYQLKNVGKTPAAEVKFIVETFLIGPGEQDMKVAERLRDVCIRKPLKDLMDKTNVSVGTVGGFLFPDETSREMVIGFPINTIEKLKEQNINSFKSILIIAYATYRFTFDDVVHVTGAPYWLIRKDVTPMIPAQKDDAFLPNGVRQIKASKLDLGLIWYGYAD